MIPKKVMAAVMGTALAVATINVLNEPLKTVPPPIPPDQQIFSQEYPPELVDWVHRISREDCKTVKRAITTPLEAAIYATSVLSYASDRELFGQRDYWASFDIIHNNKKDDCDGAVVAAVTLLEDDGYPPLALLIKESGSVNDIKNNVGAHNNIRAHIIYAFEKNGLWYSIGINKGDVNLSKSLEILVANDLKAIGFTSADTEPYLIRGTDKHGNIKYFCEKLNPLDLRFFLEPDKFFQNFFK